MDHDISIGSSSMKDVLSKSGNLGLHVLEDLTALAAGGSVCTDFPVNFLFIFVWLSSFFGFTVSDFLYKRH